MNDIYIGVLSGTSMDAIDVAAVDFSKHKPTIIDTFSAAIPSAYKTACLKIINSGQCSLIELGELDHWIGDLFANTVLEFLQHTNIPKDKIAAIGSHGQTIWHAPDANRPFTMQIGDPNIIAVKTGLTTIADFRRADIAAGGKGAPLIPAFHQACFSSAAENRCVVNIGGISNISFLSQGTVHGFDPGPGNCLMDLWTKQHFNLDYDKDGEIARSGKISPELLDLCMADPYFTKPAPKSTGLEYFNQQWLAAKLAKIKANITPADILATLLQITATCISQAILESNCSDARIYLFGGGSKNLTLCTALSKQLDRTIQTTQALGIEPSWMEAALFAWLAKETYTRSKVDLTSTTGATQPVILGGIYGQDKR